MFDPLTQQPSEAVLYVNSQCNAKCRFCLRQSVGYPSAPVLTGELLEELLEVFPRIGSACIAGFGEPLMASTLPELLRVCQRRNIYNGIITNGFLITDRIDDVPFELTNHVTVSVNAWSAESHGEAFGLPNISRRVEAGVALLADGRMPTIASFVVDAGNVTKIDRMLTYALELGFPHAYVINTLPHGGVEPITVDNQQAIDAIEAAKEHAKELGIGVSVWPTLVEPGKNPRRCLSPFSRIGIDGNGDVTGCIRIIPPAPGQGNISEGPLVWATSTHLQRLRAGLAGMAPLVPECERCFGAWVRS